MRKPNGYVRIMVGAALVLMGAAVSAQETIAGGTPFPIREAPWHLLLPVEEPDGNLDNCAASWSGGGWVLAAAHCVVKSY